MLSSESEFFPPSVPRFLLQDLGDDAGAHRAAALADREAQLLLHRDRRDQLDRHLRVVHAGQLAQPSPLDLRPPLALSPPHALPPPPLPGRPGVRPPPPPAPPQPPRP